MTGITKVKCKLYNRWYWSVESAGLLIESPAGGHVWIKKSAINVVGVSVEAQQLMRSIGTSGDVDSVELTIEQMQQLLAVAKLVKGCFYRVKEAESIYTI